MKDDTWWAITFLLGLLALLGTLTYAFWWDDESQILAGHYLNNSPYVKTEESNIDDKCVLQTNQKILTMNITKEGVLVAYKENKPYAVIIRGAVSTHQVFYSLNEMGADEAAELLKEAVIIKSDEDV